MLVWNCEWNQCLHLIYEEMLLAIERIICSLKLKGMAPLTGVLQPSVSGQCEPQMAYSILHGVPGRSPPIYCQPCVSYSYNVRVWKQTNQRSWFLMRLDFVRLYFTLKVFVIWLVDTAPYGSHCHNTNFQTCWTAKHLLPCATVQAVLAVCFLKSNLWLYGTQNSYHFIFSAWYTTGMEQLQQCNAPVMTGFLKRKKEKKKETTCHSHIGSLHSVRDKSGVPFNSKGRQSETREDSLTVWGRLEAQNRCYYLINNSVGQGWASSSAPLWGPVWYLLSTQNI